MNNERSNKRKPYRGPNLYDKEQAPKRIRMPSHHGERPGPSGSAFPNESYMDIDDDFYMDIPDRSHHQRPSHSPGPPQRRPSEPYVSPYRGSSRPHGSSRPFVPPQDPQNCGVHRVHPQDPSPQCELPRIQQMPADNNFVESPFRASRNSRRDRGRPG